MNITVKDKFRRLANKYAGRVLIHNYAGKSLAFTPLAKPEPSSIPCNCGDSTWNATNFGNTIHFCPEREIEVVVTDYVSLEVPL